jgi:hypothetical protein
MKAMMNYGHPKSHVRAAALLILIFIGSGFLQAQDDALQVEERSRMTRIGMSVLGGWALGNIALGLPLYLQSSGETRSFHEMNIGWNVVNLGIAGAGFLSTPTADAAIGYDQALAEQRRLESALLFNAGLDIGYMAAGWALLERSKRGLPDSQRLSGWGTSLILQGGFLFIFDMAFYLFLRQVRPIPQNP